MKRLFLILLSFLVLSPSTSFAGSFYNPKPEKLKEKGREAAEKLNESFVDFYQMLRNIEGRKTDDAKKNKGNFDISLGKAWNKFNAIYKETPADPLLFPELTDQLRGALDYYQKEFLNNRQINTQKILTEVPVILIGRLIKESVEFEITPTETDFYTKLRSLIISALDVQWVGVRVSQLWSVAIID